MKRILILLMFLPLNFILGHSQFIEEIIEYRPAPGQFINQSSSGVPEAANSITGKEGGLVSLGSLGGYIVFRFDNPVINDPDHPFGVDFTLFGNSMPGWSEPAAVYVMQDENGNQMPDDTWYLLAGSDYYFSSSLHQHTIWYIEPENPGGEIIWRNSEDQSGIVAVNDFHMQEYYPGGAFPGSFYRDSCIFKGMRIQGKLESGTGAAIRSLQRKFGFADNHPGGESAENFPDNPFTEIIEGYGGDAFDLNWAVDEKGNYVDLPAAHFIKVQTAMPGFSDETGEISSELRGGKLTAPDPAIRGEDRVLLIEDIPSDLFPGSFQLKAYYFEKGRYVPDMNITWVSGNAQFHIDPTGMVELTEGLEVEVYATANEGEVISGKVELRTSEAIVDAQRPDYHGITAYPNPARDYVKVESEKTAAVIIYDLSGRKIREIDEYHGGESIDISDIPPGLYFLHWQHKDQNEILSLVKI